VPLANGSLAYIAQRYISPGNFEPVLVRIPSRAAPSVTALPPVEGLARYAEAISPDGTVWIAHACKDRITRVLPDGRIGQVPLPNQRCSFEDERRSVLAVGGEGSVWLFNSCQGRVVRVPLVGRARTWRTAPPGGCQDLELSPAIPIRPTDDGGLRFPGGRIDAAGRLHRTGVPVPVAETPDGSTWVVRGAVIVQRTGAGNVRRIRETHARTVLAWTVGPDGRFWFVAGLPHDDDYGDWWATDAQLGAVDGAGRVVRQALSLTASPSDRAFDFPPLMVAGADGSVWMTEYTTPGHPVENVVRLTPAGPLPPPVRRAVPVRVLARRAGTAWIQVACTARPGLFCDGSARIATGGIPVPFVIPGGERRPCKLTLTVAARSTLRRRGVLAIATRVNGEAVVRRTLRLESR
jgi:streptogramin lyase